MAFTIPSFQVSAAYLLLLLNCGGLTRMWGFQFFAVCYSMLSVVDWQSELLYKALKIASLNRNWTVFDQYSRIDLRTQGPIDSHESTLQHVADVSNGDREPTAQLIRFLHFEHLSHNNIHTCPGLLQQLNSFFVDATALSVLSWRCQSTSPVSVCALFSFVELSRNSTRCGFSLTFIYQKWSFRMKDVHSQIQSCFAMTICFFTLSKSKNGHAFGAVLAQRNDLLFFHPFLNKIWNCPCRNVIVVFSLFMVNAWQHLGARSMLFKFLWSSAARRTSRGQLQGKSPGGWYKILRTVPDEERLCLFRQQVNIHEAYQNWQGIANIN